MKFTGAIFAALSVSSVFAAPTPAPVSRADPLALVLSTVSSLKTTVETELTTITATINGVEVTDVVVKVDASLKTIVTEIEGVVGTIVPLILGIALPIAEGEIETVLAIVSDVQTLVADIETTLKATVGSVAADALEALSAEIAAVTALVGPLATPVIGLAFGVVGTVGDIAFTNPLVAKLLGATNGLKTIVGGILSPVTGIVAGLPVVNVVGGVLGSIL